jgi:RimJ/RimL family protein N-acetyltransferase
MQPKNEWQGQLVRLRAIEPTDWELHYEWNQDSEITRNANLVWHPTSQASVKQQTEQAAVKEYPEPDKIALIIETLDGQPVGRISTHKCDPRSGTFIYGITLRRQHHRQGYASDAMQILFRQFFLERRYQKVVAHVFSFNAGSIALHEKFGMQLEGRLRRMIYTQGQYFDDVIFGMTAEEFFAKYPLESE